MLTGTVHLPPRSPFPATAWIRNLTHQMLTDQGSNVRLIDPTGRLNLGFGRRFAIHGQPLDDGTVLVTHAFEAPAAPAGVPGLAAAVGRIVPLPPPRSGPPRSGADPAAPTTYLSPGPRHALVIPGQGAVPLASGAVDLDGLVGNAALVEGRLAGALLWVDRVQLLAAA